MDNYNRHVINIVFLNVCVWEQIYPGEKIYIRQSLQNFNPWEGVYISTYIGLPRTLIFYSDYYKFCLFPCNFYMIKDEKFAKIRFNF